MSQQDNKEMAKHFYRASAADFKKIPGSPVAYWLEKASRNVFMNGSSLESVSEIKQGLATCNNDRFLRLWFEVDLGNVAYSIQSTDAAFDSGKKWFPYNKGGGFRKWYGNNEFLVNWKNNGEDIHRYSNLPLDYSGAPVRAKRFYFRDGITYGLISSFGFSARRVFGGFIFDVGGSMIFPKINSGKLQAFLCSNLTKEFISILNPTLNYQVGDVQKLPILEEAFNKIIIDEDYIINIAKNDWDSYETSWDFSELPQLYTDMRQMTLEASYYKLRSYWLETTLEMQRLEEENNRLFIDAYGLQDELTPEVPLAEITLTCNPHYRYGGNLSDEEREARLQSDTIAELVSYAIGCMMGRYSLDREGLVYAHAGNVGFNDLVAEGAYQRFAADGDGILPLTSEHWFEDDIAARIEEFVRTVWGADTLEENLQFIADSLCLYAIKPPKKGGETSRETIRRYLSTQFFKDHLKTYKKRPIYWLFSSGKEKAFECLVYLHRYNEATLPRMRTEYVTPLLGQMASRIERLRLQKSDASTAEAKRLDKQIDGLTKQLAELRAFDDQLKHHADMKITLDLDDGVKVNYGKFGTLLSDVKAITGDKGE